MICSRCNDAGGSWYSPGETETPVDDSASKLVVALETALSDYRWSLRPLCPTPYDTIGHQHLQPVNFAWFLTFRIDKGNFGDSVIFWTMYTVFWRRVMYQKIEIFYYRIIKIAVPQEMYKIKLFFIGHFLFTKI